MIPILIDILIFCVVFFSIWFFLYIQLPKLAKQAALCRLHDLRDALYHIQSNIAPNNSSLIFQDMIYSMTLLIRLVRDTPRRESIPFLCNIIIRSNITSYSLPESTSNNKDWRSKRYDYELKTIFNTDNGIKALHQTMKIYERKDLSITMFLIASVPPISILTFFAAPILLLVWAVLYIYSIIRPNHMDTSSISGTINAIRAYNPNQSLGFLH